VVCRKTTGRTGAFQEAGGNSGPECCILTAVIKADEFSGGRFLDTGMVTECAKIHSGASVTVLCIYAVETFAGSVAVALSGRLNGDRQVVFLVAHANPSIFRALVDCFAVYMYIPDKRY